MRHCVVNIFKKETYCKGERLYNMFFQRRRYKFDKECAYHSYCNYVQKVFPYFKFNRDNDRSLHHFYTFLWNQKHPFLFLGRTMLVSLLPVLDVYYTNYFICKNQHIYTVMYNRVEKVFAVLDSNEEQIRFVTPMELYMELTNAEYVFMELNKSIAPNIVQKLFRIENKNNYYRANCMNIRLVVQNYDNTIATELDKENADVVRERIYAQSGEDYVKKFEMEAMREYNKLVAKDVQRAKKEVNAVRTDEAKVVKSEPEKPTVVKPKEPVKKDGTCPRLCRNCGTTGPADDYLTERRIARKVIPSKQTLEYGIERHRTRKNAAVVVPDRVTDPEKLRGLYPKAKSPSYYRNLRQNTRKNKDSDPLRKLVDSSKKNDNVVQLETSSINITDDIPVISDIPALEEESSTISLTVDKITDGGNIQNESDADIRTIDEPDEETILVQPDSVSSEPDSISEYDTD